MSSTAFQKGLETRSKNTERRKSMSCKTVELKLVNLNKTQKNKLNEWFYQAKCVYNDIISHLNENSEKKISLLKGYDTKISAKVYKLNKDKQKVEVEMSGFPFSMKQNLLKRVETNINTFFSLKKKNKKVGLPTFKREINSLALKGYKSEFRFKNGKVRLVNFPGWISLKGFHQIKKLKNVEFVQSNLIRKPDGFYIHVVLYHDPQFSEIYSQIKENIGIDFGVKDALILSNGFKINIELKRIRKIENRINVLKASLSKRKDKFSKNSLKLKNLIRRHFLKCNNIKQDFVNKTFSYLKNNFNKIFIQDENIKAWFSKFGKQLQNYGLGKILFKLRLLKDQVLEINRFIPSTKQCYMCGTHINLSLNDRVFKCINCGFEADRDVKAANYIKFYGEAVLLGGGPTLESRNPKTSKEGSSNEENTLEKEC